MTIAATAAALLAVSTPNSASTSATPRTEQPEKWSAAESKEAFDLDGFMAIFDKLFPAKPDPVPERLALSRIAAQGLLPDGTYGKAMEGLIGHSVNLWLTKNASFAADNNNNNEKPPSAEAFCAQAMKEDPYCEERIRIIHRVLGEEIAKIAALLEPKLREGLARSMARRFDQKQLTDINAFLVTDSGRAFGAESMTMWVDSEVMRAVVTSMPDLFATMPNVIKRLETETAHLPKPPRKDKSDEQSEEE